MAEMKSAPAPNLLLRIRRVATYSNLDIFIGRVKRHSAIRNPPMGRFCFSFWLQPL